MNIFLNTKKRYDMKSFKYIQKYKKEYIFEDRTIFRKKKFNNKTHDSWYKIGVKNLGYMLDYFRERTTKKQRKGSSLYHLRQFFFGIATGGHENSFEEIVKFMKETNCRIPDFFTSNMRLASRGNRYYKHMGLYSGYITKNLVVCKKIFHPWKFGDRDTCPSDWFVTEKNISLWKILFLNHSSTWNMFTCFVNNFELAKTCMKYHVKFNTYHKYLASFRLYDI